MLTAQDVMRRYGFRDPRAARRAIQQAGGRRIGGRWLVSPERIKSWEQQAIKSVPLDPERNRINDQPRASQIEMPSELKPGWWREA